MPLSTERLGLYNPDKPMENRLTDLGPRHFWQYFPPVIQNYYGKWDYHGYSYRTLDKDGFDIFKTVF